MNNILESLNEGMHAAMTQDERVVFLGEDILDPYGGAFKLASGLSTRFPERVFTTPISEAGITGVATGMALRGLRPVVEIMFGDFLTLASDQLINHAAKFRWMYNNQTCVPLVVRTPMGGRRGYGPTHSQTIEKHFLGVPGLRLVAPSVFCDPGQLLLNAILKDDDPVLFIENKLLYSRRVKDLSELVDYQATIFDETYPTTLLTFVGGDRSRITFACYGYVAELVSEAMTHLAYEHEIFSEAVIFSNISPLNNEPLLDSLERTHCLLTVEEGGRTGGWGSEVISSVLESSSGWQLHAASRVAALDLPIPATRVLEEHVLPDVDDVVEATIEILERGNAQG